MSRIPDRRTLVRAALVAGVVVVLAGGGWWWSLVHDLPDASAIKHIGDTSQATIVYDAVDGPASTLFEEQRIDVPLERVSNDFIQAILAIEDRRFYSHGAVDLPRIASAALTNVVRGRAAQGASTLTQQLARAGFLTSTKTIRRKLQEVILASRIERQYTKRQILELYANRVYFGSGLWGVEAASLGYFGKHAAALTLPESALLAGLVKSPSTYAPTVDADRAIRRRAVVLQAMLETGAIDRATLDDANHSRLELKDAFSRRQPRGEYFFEDVRKSLVEQFGSDRVYGDGLRVYSTIDLGMQAAAEAAVGSALQSLDQRRARAGTVEHGPSLQAALIAIDPQTGYVRALVGGRSFTDSRFNRATQAYRQPGSAFKPIVYAAALEAGYTEASVIDRLDEPVSTPKGGWLPDDEHVDAASLDLRNALRVSSNRAAMRVSQQIGIPLVIRSATAFGLTNMPAVPSLALGSGEVTLSSLTAAYAAFANGGLLRTPVLIRRVEDGKGAMLMEARDNPSRALSETTAFLMSDMLTDVINSGTAAQARTLGFKLPAAGKTGTTNGFNDAWFIGFTPRLVVGVWVGFDSPRTIARNGFAAAVAVPLWTAFMSAATKGDPPVWLEPPPGVEVADICPASGQLATGDCPNHRRLYFAAGTRPIQNCHVHRPALLREVLGLVGIGGGPPPMPPPHVDVAGGRTSVHAADLPPQASGDEAPPPAPAKKRGFWSRLLRPGR